MGFIHLLLGAVVAVLSILPQQALSANPYLDKKPNFIHTCNFGDPPADFDKCTTKDVQAMFTQLAKGMPEIGILPLDPLLVEKITIAQGDGPVNLDVTVRNVTVRGMQDAVVIANKMDPKTYGFRTKILVKRLLITGIYKANGRILVVPIRGQGESYFDCGDIQINTDCDVNLIKKKNHHFFDIKKVRINFDIKSMKLRLDNLFDGNKELEQGTNEYLNKNWKEVSDILKPILVETIEEIILSILRQFFGQIPAKHFIGDLNI